MSLKPKPVDFDATWDGIQETVKNVVTLGKIQRNVWNDRFADVYSLCVAYPDPLGEKLYKETESFITVHVHTLKSYVESRGEENLLEAYHDSWLVYSKGTAFLDKLYMYLNNQYVKKQKFSEADLTYGGLDIKPQNNMLEVGELALYLWRKYMLDPFKSQLVHQLLEGVEKDRLGNDGGNSSSVLHNVILSIVTVEEYQKTHQLELYQEIFEKPFLEATAEYYQWEATRLLQDFTASQYMEKVIQRINEENLRSRKFLHPSSYPKVTKQCEQTMVMDHLPYLLGECKAMVTGEIRHDLHSMYILLKPLPDSSLSHLVQQIQCYIRQKGLDAIAHLKGDNVPAQFVENMLGVHSKYRDLVKEVFNNDQLFTGALDKACASVINHRPNPKQACRSPELLAKYCDLLLKKSSKGVSDTEMDDKLGQSIIIFRYIEDKDVFQKFYSRMLAKRLIFQQSQSMDAEEAMVTRLKQACGYEFTNKLHRMFKDMSVSADLNNKFYSFLKNESIDLGISFAINVLQAGAWPLGQSNPSSFAVPQQLEKSISMFESFYRHKFNGRKLTWLHHLCQAELRLCYLSRPYIVSMQTFQMAILLLFERSDSLTGQEIQEATQLNFEQFSKHIISLVDSKILLTSPSPFQNTEEGVRNTSFTLNTKFSNKRTKFRIAVAVQKDNPQEAEQTHVAVDEDRKLYLQAAVVRIMKARKLLRHNLLIQEVLSQSQGRFTPSVPMIKKCIEILIDKQYLERTPSSADEYSYVA